MGKESEDKAERVLSLYTRLKHGKIICKEKESTEYNVSTRTIQRDIADIQCFLQNQNVQTGEVQEIVYDKSSGGYILQTKYKNQLEGKEILAVARVLLDSRALIKNEMFPIIHKLMNVCSDETEAKMIAELLRNEMHHYVELQHGEQLLECIWRLEQAIKNQQFLEIKYMSLKKQISPSRRIKPMGIIFSEFYFYLIAFIVEKIPKEGGFQWEEYSHPTIYRVDRLEDICYLDEHFAVPYTERFEEGLFRKRIQFMHGGKLKKVRLKCKEQSLEAVLDRLPTAEIVERDGEDYVVQAEVFGNGIDMWIRGQGDSVKLF